MKKIVLMIGWLFSFIYTIGIDKKISGFKNNLYTGWMKRRFLHFEGYLAGPISLTGGEYVSVGAETVISRDVRIGAYARFGRQTFSSSVKIIVGKNCRIGKDCMLSAIDRIEIGDNVAVTARTLVLDNVHGEFRDNKLTFENGTEIPDVFLQNVFTRDLASRGPVVIENDVHIGEGCVILPGVRIGHHSVIAASSVVAKNVPPYSIVSGKPAMVAVTFGA